MDRRLPFIEVGYPVFLLDGADAFGAVREVLFRNLPVILVNVEGAGDFAIPLEAIDKVVNKKVVVRWEMLGEALQEAIRHVQDVEDFPPPDEGEVDLVPPPLSEDEDDSLAPTYDAGLHHSPPSELPGRDVGSRFGAPPSVTSPRRRR
ncbi:MAG: hypothetical protein HY698_06455 [Deltaproteobacteria bacterium]|nr:hypothetical protein [Deltaproteobacteria bacterium]